jgi:hypothetical protein
MKPKFKDRDMIMCCLFRVISQLMGTVMDVYGAMVE